MVTLDVLSVFEFFGGPRGLLDALDKHQPDNNLRYGAVQMWHQRGRVPPNYLPAVLMCLEREGVSWHRFVRDRALDELGLADRPSARQRRRRALMHNK